MYEAYELVFAFFLRLLESAAFFAVLRAFLGAFPDAFAYKHRPVSLFARQKKKKKKKEKEKHRRAAPRDTESLGGSPTQSQHNIKPRTLTIFLVCVPAPAVCSSRSKKNVLAVTCFLHFFCKTKSPACWRFQTLRKNKSHV
jgi:hypothetical protein